MKQYIVFMYDVHRPSGGWNDVLRVEGEMATFDDLDEAIGCAKRNNPHKLHYDIVDLAAGRAVICHG